MMRGLRLALFAAPVILAGCGAGDDAPMKTNPALVKNPGGNAANLPPQVQGLGAQQQAAGAAASRNMDEASRQMKAAQARAKGQ
jgi:hypothetical protein